MKQLCITIVLIVTSFGLVSAQEGGVFETSQLSLEEVSLDKFEDASFWEVSISSDDGIVTYRSFEGGPNEENGRNFLPNDQESDANVLGIRVDYRRRSLTTISIKPIRPIIVPGIGKTLSVWVAGRNNNHLLNLHVTDYSGREFKLSMGKLNFSGWRKLSVAIPSNIQQYHSYYGDKQNMQITGFSINPDLLETIGSYYVYFDDLRVFTDLFAVEAGMNPNDPSDNW